jgi:hypothetical protein
MEKGVRSDGVKEDELACPSGRCRSSSLVDSTAAKFPRAPKRAARGGTTTMPTVAWRVWENTTATGDEGARELVLLLLSGAQEATTRFARTPAVSAWDCMDARLARGTEKGDERTHILTTT